jgi:hypothetical protein
MGESGLERGVEFDHVLDYGRHTNLAQVYATSNPSNTPIDA